MNIFTAKATPPPIGGYSAHFRNRLWASTPSRPLQVLRLRLLATFPSKQQASDIPARSGGAVRPSKWIEKVVSTPRVSQAVAHPSTNRALSCFTLEFGWDPVLSRQYGRQQRCVCQHFQNPTFSTSVSDVMAAGGGSRTPCLHTTTTSQTKIHLSKLPVKADSKTYNSLFVTSRLQESFVGLDS